MRDRVGFGINENHWLSGHTIHIWLEMSGIFRGNPRADSIDSCLDVIPICLQTLKKERAKRVSFTPILKKVDLQQ